MLLTTNDILFKIKNALDLTKEDMLKAYALENFSMDATHLDNILKPSKNRHFELCSYEELGVFLDGFITLKRGPSPKKDDEEAVELTNNLILKKLRIALELKEHELEMIFALADVELGKQQLASLFRKEGHKNFKKCSDEMLAAFLEGLDEFYFTGNELE